MLYYNKLICPPEREMIKMDETTTLYDVIEETLTENSFLKTDENVSLRNRTGP